MSKEITENDVLDFLKKNPVLAQEVIKDYEAAKVKPAETIDEFLSRGIYTRDERAAMRADLVFDGTGEWLIVKYNGQTLLQQLVMDPGPLAITLLRILGFQSERFSAVATGDNKAENRAVSESKPATDPSLQYTLTEVLNNYLLADVVLAMVHVLEDKRHQDPTPKPLDDKPTDLQKDITALWDALHRFSRGCLRPLVDRRA